MATLYLVKTITGLLLTAASTLYGQPNPFAAQTILGCKIYGDAARPEIFYYEPLHFKLATDHDGRPHVKLLQMQYSGTRATADNGTIKFRNILQFKMIADPSGSKHLQDVRNALQQQGATIILKPLPVTRFRTLLVYAPVHNADSSLRILTGGYTEPGSVESGLSGSQWNERFFSIRLSDADAQLMEDALRRRQALISMSYAVYTSFSATTGSGVTANISEGIDKQVLQYFDSIPVYGSDSTLKEVMIQADAIPIDVDVNKWEDVIQKIDINEKLPPNYPLFDVYCYDFNNALRPELFIKSIEIRATGINGNEISSTGTFKSAQPDQYVKSILFPFAVKFNKPYRFRITEITNEGESLTSGWVTRHSWSDIIDITSIPNNAIQQ